ncbi:MAG: GNAT family N-acetyltransferase [Chloroflexi bacterium]|nr:GNAT family N-acetyltransferase [Chloroflexota bacterium]
MVEAIGYNLSCFPLEAPLLDDATVILRPMVAQDEDALLAFFQGIPEEERYFMREDAASPGVVRRWATGLDYDLVLPLLAFVEGAIVGDVTLARDPSPARRHVGHLSVCVHPGYRGLGLGTIMMHHMMVLANERGMEALTFEAVADHEEHAIRSAIWLGFSQAARLRGAAKDAEGKKYDVIVMEALLGKWYDWWPLRVSAGQVHVRFPWVA